MKRSMMTIEKEVILHMINEKIFLEMVLWWEGVLTNAHTSRPCGHEDLIFD